MTTNQLPTELLDLDIKHNEFKHWNGSGSEWKSFISQLQLANTLYSDSENISIQDKLLEHWLNHFRYYFHHLGGQFMEVPVADLDSFFEFLYKNVGAIDRLKEFQDKAAVASLCLFRVQHRQKGHLYPKGHMRAMLKQWSGKDVPREALFMPEEAVNFIYGPACWSLYHGEVHKVSRLPVLLWKLQIPLAIEKPSLNAQEVNSLDLPADFTNGI